MLSGKPDWKQELDCACPNLPLLPGYCSDETVLCAVKTSKCYTKVPSYTLIGTLPQEGENHQAAELSNKKRPSSQHAQL